MQAMMLAAGMGKRLKDLTQDNTKCMLKVHGKTLIERALDILVDAGISKMIMVIGYRGENVRGLLGDSYRSMPIEYIDNPIFNETNNIYSLWLARKELCEDDTILLESDLIFEPSMVTGMIEDSRPNLAAVAPFKSWMDGTVVCLDEKDNIIRFLGKDAFKFKEVDEYYKTVNIYKFSKEFSQKSYVPFLDAYCTALGHNEYYEQVLKVVTYLDNTDLQGYRIKKEKWYEIDDVQDLNNAEAIFAEPDQKLELYNKRFGGYWRFPSLIDFCYLVNPYFPPRRLLDEMECFFQELIAEYPSGQGINRLLASKMFGVGAEQILVGNGAAEIINGLMELQTGKVGFICPTFVEYMNRVPADQRKVFIPKNSNFTYTVDELIEFSTDIDTLVLINPDNPSGQMIAKAEVLRLATWFESHGKQFILDESFVDFSDESEENSCISREIIEQFSNLVIVKSISKSYGVPGIRLGVVVSSNGSTMKKIQQKLSIWNINSFGEFFLQIIGKYEKEYARACTEIIAERNRFFKVLSEIPFLRVIPSQANYFLCEVTSVYTARTLTERLLVEKDLYIKDNTGKLGFEHGEYVRIAIRNKKDNNKLVKMLKKF